MAPNGMISSLKAGILSEAEDVEVRVKEGVEDEHKFKPQLIWTNIISITLLHVVAVVSTIKWYADTNVYTYIWGEFGSAKPVEKEYL